MVEVSHHPCYNLGNEWVLRPAKGVLIRMKPRKKGKQWEICYRCPGYPKPIYQRFDSLEAANLRIAEVKFARSCGQLKPPPLVTEADSVGASSKHYMTVAELMDEYVQLYGLNNWGDSYLSYSRHRIEHYIKPYIGKELLCNLTTHKLDTFFASLQKKPAVVQKGHRSTGKTVSLAVIEKVYALLRNAFKQAVAWGYIQANPALNVTLPKRKSTTRKVWTPEQAKMALERCQDPILHLAMMLALGCSLRIGEILALTWDCVDITPASIANGTAVVHVTKELKRCDNQSLEDLRHRNNANVLFTFPSEKRTAAKTSLVLKTTKTESSVRDVFLPETVANTLRQMQISQERSKNALGEAYKDFNLVLAHENGRPYEERQIADLLRNFIRDANLPPVVFHSLRHCSTSVKLQLSNGNIKAVQGDTGHAQARMVTDTYAHTNNEERRILAQKMDQSFFQGTTKDTSSPASEIDERLSHAIQIVTKNPDIANLIIALSEHPSGN